MILSALTDRRKAVLQRFLVSVVHGEMANRMLYETYYRQEAPDFTKPIELRVMHWYNWIVKASRLESRLQTVYDKLRDYEVSVVASREYQPPGAYIAVDSKILFSRLLDFEFAKVIKQPNALYNLDASDCGDAKPTFKYGAVSCAVEKFAVFDAINELFSFTQEGYPSLQAYSDGKCYELNRTCRTLFMNSFDPGKHAREMSKPDVFTGISISKLVSEMNSLTEKTHVNVSRILQMGTQLVVFRGAELPWVNSVDDIFTVKKPFVYTCPAFFSTSVNYRITLSDKYIGQVVWRLEVRTTRFVSLAHMHWANEKELLFGPGQLIEVSAVSRNEEGRVVVHGALIDGKADLLGGSDGGQQIQVQEHRGELGSDSDPEVRLLEVNEKRLGTVDSPFFIMFDDGAPRTPDSEESDGDSEDLT